MRKLKLGVIGCGFWSRYQTAAWQEFDQVHVVAACDRDLNKAKDFSNVLQIPRTYADATNMLNSEELDVVEVITDPDTHAPLVKLAASHGVAVICQKPMAPQYQVAQEMHQFCLDKKVPFFIHENFRWQQPIRACYRKLQSGIIGKPF